MSEVTEGVVAAFVRSEYRPSAELGGRWTLTAGMCCNHLVVVRRSSTRLPPRWRILDSAADVASVLWTTEAPVLCERHDRPGAFVHQIIRLFRLVRASWRSLHTWWGSNLQSLPPCPKLQLVSEVNKFSGMTHPSTEVDRYCKKRAAALQAVDGSSACSQNGRSGMASYGHLVRMRHYDILSTQI